MEDLIRPGSYVGLRLPSETLKLVEIQPNSTISLGKFGTFQTNHLIGRPFHLTYEIIDKTPESGPRLRSVPVSELHDLGLGEAATPDDDGLGGNGVDFEVVDGDGKVVMRTNQYIVDDEVTQKLTVEDIEALKKADSSGGKDVIAKILESHSTLDKKTSFSLAKYTLRKSRKYMKRFTALPVDIPLIMNWLLDGKDAPRIMEMREETLGLMTSYSNVHWVGDSSEKNGKEQDNNRWLVVDEISGLLVAAMAEKMGILYPSSGSSKPVFENLTEPVAETTSNGTAEGQDEARQARQNELAKMRQNRIYLQELAMSGKTNTITIVHQNAQPNLSLLTYFGYNTSNPDMTHPLYANLKEISFLQLLHPEKDYACLEPPEATADQLKDMKGRLKSAYYRKRRRWQRTRAIVNETQAGGFAGLVVASAMDPASVLHRLVPLLRGGAQVVVYSPVVEPLTEIADCYSKARRTAYVASEDPIVPSKEFPVDPRLLIGATIHTTKARPWQVLPGRTHPIMTGRGGSDGYIFIGTRVLPVDGRIEARGNNKRRKLDVLNSSNQNSPPASASEELRAETSEAMAIQEMDKEEALIEDEEML